MNKELEVSQVMIRKVNASGSVVSSAPTMISPCLSFLFLTQGEVLVEIEKRPYICGAGQLLLIPVNTPFFILHFQDAVGYDGYFRADVLPDARVVSLLRQPLQQAFWFDEASFVAELFKMLETANARGNRIFLEKGFDLLLSMLDTKPSIHLPDVVSAFLDRAFQEDGPILSASEIAAEKALSLNYLNRLVKQTTGRSVGAWIDVVRITRAKRLLRETDMPMIDVAVGVGLDDQSYFARFFKRHTGMTPTAFRKMMHESS